MKNRIDERALTRKFLNSLNESMTQNICSACGQCPCRCIELCGECNCDPCECDSHVVPHDMHDGMHGMHDEEHGESHGPLQADQYGVVSKDELYSHFDLDNDGTVTPEEYTDHIEFHCAHPETLSHYQNHRHKSCEVVPCKKSYDSASQHFMGQPDLLLSFVNDACEKTGSTCHTSTMQGMFDVLKSLKDAGII